MKTVSRFYAAEVLNAPASTEARTSLKQATSDEQIVQVCNTEAMEQIAKEEPGAPPDKVIAYARVEIVVQDGSLIANGAAVRRQGNWHELRYHCAVTPGSWAVLAFAYAIGKSIPRHLWDQLALPYD
ncbi:DUF930 domain-containing protein [Roseibium sp.]|uniref:DUF930 domain-containing protein n=1 Tax=Roseibium sp. TaxID=1936156 RepID=UPI003A984BE4